MGRADLLMLVCPLGHRPREAPDHEPHDGRHGDRNERERVIEPPHHAEHEDERRHRACERQETAQEQVAHAPDVGGEPPDEVSRAQPAVRRQREALHVREERRAEGKRHAASDRGMQRILGEAQRL